MHNLRLATLPLLALVLLPYYAALALALVVVALAAMALDWLRHLTSRPPAVKHE